METMIVNSLVFYQVLSITHKILLQLFTNKEEQNLKYIKKINSLGITIPPRTVKDISIKIKGIDASLFYNFDFIDKGEPLYIESTHRNFQELVDIAGNFIMKIQFNQKRT